MSIQVLMTLVSVLLRTCIKVLSKHIRCTESLSNFEIEFTVMLSLYLPRTLCVIQASIKLVYIFCCYLVCEKSVDAGG